MTLPRVYAMTQHWQDHPPLNLMVQAYLGIKPDKSPPATPQGPVSNNSGDLLGLFQAAGGRVVQNL